MILVHWSAERLVKRRLACQAYPEWRTMAIDTQPSLPNKRPGVRFNALLNKPSKPNPARLRSIPPWLWGLLRVLVCHVDAGSIVCLSLLRLSLYRCARYGDQIANQRPARDSQRSLRTHHALRP